MLNAFFVLKLSTSVVRAHTSRESATFYQLRVSALQISVSETPTAGAKETRTPEKIRKNIKMPVSPIDRATNAEVGVVGQGSITLFCILNLKKLALWFATSSSLFPPMMILHPVLALIVLCCNYRVGGLR